MRPFEEVCHGRIDVTPMFGWTVGLEDVPSAIQVARDATGPARIIVVPSMTGLNLMISESWARVKWFDPLVDRLRKAGLDVTAFARRPEARSNLEDAGVPCVDNLAALARRGVIAIVYVFTDDQGRSVRSSTTASPGPWSQARRSSSTRQPAPARSKPLPRRRLRKTSAWSMPLGAAARPRSLTGRSRIRGGDDATRLPGANRLRGSRSCISDDRELERG